MLTFLAICTALLVAFTLLPIWRTPHWVVRSMEFPRLQFAVVAAVLLPAIAIHLHDDRRLAGYLLVTLLVVLIWQGWWILPYLPRLRRPEVKDAVDPDPARCIRILTANVLMTNRDASRLLALVRQHEPDILVALEGDRWWEEQLDTIGDAMPHTMKCALDNLYGMHVYSRLPLEEAELAFLVEEDKPSVHALAVLRNGERVRVHFLHPAPPSPTENPESAERDAELVIVARSVAKATRPVIVTGDLNDVAWSATTRLFRKISGLLDPRVGRGMFNTFHARYPFMRWPLDHIFHSRDFTLASIERMPGIGSDHFPLLTTLCLTPEARPEQDGLHADAEDEERGDEIAAEEGASPARVPTPGD